MTGNLAQSIKTAQQKAKPEKAPAKPTAAKTKQTSKPKDVAAAQKAPPPRPQKDVAGPAIPQKKNSNRANSTQNQPVPQKKRPPIPVPPPKSRIADKATPPIPPARAERTRSTSIGSIGRLTLPKMPPPPPSAPLRRAPDPALVEKSRNGSLPIVGRDGREAWRVYARPFNQEDQRPRIGVVLYGLGTSGAATRAAIQGLPGAVTLAFSPYADGLTNWMADARAAGHETLLMVPMEPRNYPDSDPGPQALLTTLSSKENTARLEWILGRGVGYVGITDFMGSRFTNSTKHMRALFRNLNKRGLLFLESRVASRALSGEIASASKTPFASNALYIDSQASRTSIDGQLAEAERLSQSLGSVIVMGFLYPVTLERIANWATTVEKRGFSLAPVSAMTVRWN
jgi:polysaccharide deacetylase 2 family uncharacterized protein YibQ